MTEDHLREYFSQFGSVASVDITKDRNTGQRRGFGFVTFDDYDPVDKVICNQLQSSNIHILYILFQLFRFMSVKSFRVNLISV